MPLAPRGMRARVLARQTAENDAGAQIARIDQNTRQFYPMPEVGPGLTEQQQAPEDKHHQEFPSPPPSGRQWVPGMNEQRGEPAQTTGYRPKGFDTGGEVPPPGVPGTVVPLPGKTTHQEIGDVTGGPIPPDEWNAASPALKRLFIKAWIAKACMAEGVDPATWGPPYEALVSRESGGYTGGVADPNIVNLYDSNAKAGIPSLGIAQVIQPNAPGENLLDPVVNIRASIRHVKEMYGTIFGVQQADPTKPKKGYNTGGEVDHPAYPNPMFTDEDPRNFAKAYAHNRPFATPGPYQTPLNEAEEKAFRAWLQANRVEFNPNDAQESYDMRGWWRATQPKGKPDFYPDTYKTPYDTTFSNESKYATPNCPFRWTDGATLTDMRDGSVVFFNPSHYASEGSRPMETEPIAPTDMPSHRADGGIVSSGNKSTYRKKWHAELLRADGSMWNLPLQMVREADGEVHWTHAPVGPGDRVRIVAYDGSVRVRQG